MRVSAAAAVLISAALLLGCAQSSAPRAPDRAEPAWREADGAIRVVGYNDMREMLTALDAAYALDHPGTRFDLILEGTKTAPAALTAGTSAFAPMGAPMFGADLAAYRRAWRNDPLEIRVAHASLRPTARSGPLGFVVHRDTPIDAVDLESARGVFAAAAPVWGDLGLTGSWASRPIHPCGLKQDAALGYEMARALELPAFGAAFTGLTQSVAVMQQAAADPLALCFAAIHVATPQVTVLAVARRPGETAIAPNEAALRAGNYPLDRFLMVAVRRPAGVPVEPEIAAYLRFVLSDRGRAVIEAGSLGYFPLSAAEAERERAKLN